MKIDTTVLRSKVARRVFGLFVLCALLPLTVLALFSISSVTVELSRQADQRLHQLCKATGMTMVERLHFLETDLKMIISNLESGSPHALEAATREMRERLNDRFLTLVLVGQDGRVTASLGPVPALPELDEEEVGHLAAGKTLLSMVPKPDGATVFLVRAVDAGGRRSPLLYGAIRSVHLWGVEDSLPPMTDFLAFAESGQPLRSSFRNLPPRELRAAMPGDELARGFEWSHQGRTYLVRYWTIFMRPQFHANWTVVHLQPKDQILKPVASFKKIFLLVTLLAFWVVLLLSLSQIRRYLNPIALLREASRRIAVKDFNARVEIASKDEFEELGASFNDMADSLGRHLRVMTRLNEIGMALSAEQQVKHLLEFILFGAKEIIHADGASLYTMTESQELQLSLVQISSLPELSDDGTTIVPLHDSSGQPNTGVVAAYSALCDVTINIADIYQDDRFDFAGNRDFDHRHGYRSRSFLSVPMKNHENEVIGVLQLVNALDRHSQEVVSFTQEDQRLAESLASQAAVALSKTKLLEDFKQLFSALTELIATAIDEKSRYTGDHCRRVPVLSMMLAESACKTMRGPLKDFSLSEEELYELQVASLLHDCGKVVTPVHVVDKATKLDTIFDRIQLVSTRFEIVKRDLEIASLRERMRSRGEEEEDGRAEIEPKYRGQLEAIEKDLEFLRSCNIGTEFMPESLRQRVREISHKYTWQDGRGERKPVLSEDEVHNLTIPKGTLTPEERELINHHVVATIKMLEKLPYPKALRNVPLLAGAHHERMDGSGYPKGLTREEIPVQGRIIGVADVFEALTAKDRPYKKGKTLMEALRIMGAMCEEGHLDPDLVDVFIDDKVYLRYAEQHLDPEQIDQVVLSEIPGYVPPE